MGEDEVEYVPLAGLYAGADDDARAAVERRDDVDRPRSPATTESWLIAFLPAGALVADVVVLSAVGGALAIVAVIAVTLGATVLAVEFARGDQARLAELGHAARTQPYLAVIPAVYLFVRGHHAYTETFEGMRVAWASLVVVIAVCYAAAVVIPSMNAIGELLRQSTEYYSG
jgi:hypothetical protein